MRITLTGGSGFIGRRLVRRLLGAGHAVHLLGRRARAGLESTVWDAAGGDVPRAAVESADAVIHLAGEPVAQRWTPAVKGRIRASRAGGTERLVTAIGQAARRPHTLISASAIGYYGARGDEVLTEDSAPGAGFLPGVCREWEAAARRAEAFGVRVVRLRIGVVLGTEGGALKQMLPPFRAGIGGRLAGGRQWMSWIHIEDLVRLILFALEAPGLAGVLNAVAPQPVTNAEFTAALAAVLRRPALIPVPRLALRLLLGEAADIVLASQRVEPAAALKAGFTFMYPEIRPALRQLLE